MEKKYNKLVFVNSNFYVKNKNGKFDKCKDAKKISIEGFENLDFFAYKDKFGFWAIYDGITGCRVTKLFKELKRPLRDIKTILFNSNSRKIEQIIISSLEKRKLSPRYLYIVNPSKRR